MLENWLHFCVLVLIQFLFFIIHALYEKRISQVPRILLQGVCLGFITGIFVDFIFGKILGFHSYELGFNTPFLMINAVFSYGIFASSALLMQKARLGYWIIWLVSLVAVYEIANLYFHVWTWELPLPPMHLFTLLLIGYFAGAVSIAVNAYLFFGIRFNFIKRLL